MATNSKWNFFLKLVCIYTVSYLIYMILHRVSWILQLFPSFHCIDWWTELSNYLTNHSLQKLLGFFCVSHELICARNILHKRTLNQCKWIDWKIHITYFLKTSTNRMWIKTPYRIFICSQCNLSISRLFSFSFVLYCFVMLVIKFMFDFQSDACVVLSWGRQLQIIEKVDDIEINKC